MKLSLQALEGSKSCVVQFVPCQETLYSVLGRKAAVVLLRGSSKCFFVNKMSLNIMHSWPDIKIIDENIFLKMCSCKNKPMCENRVPK